MHADPAERVRTEQDIATPFLRWAGGKRWLARRLPDLLGDLEFGTYHEPFLGGGSVFLGLEISGQAKLSDLNAELIETYQQVRDNVEGVIKALSKHRNTESHYYRVRATTPSNAERRAARFIYLNQTSFNGIYRVNLNGEYNVPFGHRSTRFLDASNLRLVSDRLQTCELTPSDFTAAARSAREGDLVFLDPPYTVSHNHNGFIKYNQRLFSMDDQHRLASLVDRLREVGAYYILTNAAHPVVAELFDRGDSRYELTRTNVIGGLEAGRGHSSEYVFTNAF